MTNVAGSPPHFETGMSAKVFFDIGSIFKQGQTISSISTPVYYDAASQIDGRTRTTLPGELRHHDADE